MHGQGSGKGKISSLSSSTPRGQLELAVKDGVKSLYLWVQLLSSQEKQFLWPQAQGDFKLSGLDAC